MTPAINESATRVCTNTQSTLAQEKDKGLAGPPVGRHDAAAVCEQPEEHGLAHVNSEHRGVDVVDADTVLDDAGAII